MIDSLFGMSGYVVNPLDMRAMTEDEISQMQGSQQTATQNLFWHNQLARQADISNGLSGYYPSPPQKPLDDRFADFKERLAAAIAKRARDHSLRAPS